MRVIVIVWADASSSRARAPWHAKKNSRRRARRAWRRNFAARRCVVAPHISRIVRRAHTAPRVW